MRVDQVGYDVTESDKRDYDIELRLEVDVKEGVQESHSGSIARSVRMENLYKFRRDVLVFPTRH